MQTKFLEEAGTQQPPLGFGRPTGSTDTGVALPVLIFLRVLRLGIVYCVGYVLLPHTLLNETLSVWKPGS